MRGLFLSLVLGGLLVGCGDDDGAPGDSGILEIDTGTRDAGRDAGPRDSGGGGMDAGMDAGVSVLRECDVFAPDCADDEKCAFVVDQTDPENVLAFFGCVPISTGTKAEGIVCASFGADPTPDDPEDDRFTDECAEGLFCASVPGETLRRCQRICGAETIECDTSEYCLTVNSDPFFGLCAPADDCDPIFQSGCETGEACVFVRNTMEQFLGTCFPIALPDGGTGAVGEPCMFIDSCQAGAQCLRERLADGGVGDTAACRQICAQGPTDGGVPPDAAPPACPTGETCTQWPLEGTFVGPYAGGYCG